MAFLLETTNKNESKGQSIKNRSPILQQKIIKKNKRNNTNKNFKKSRKLKNKPTWFAAVWYGWLTAIKVPLPGKQIL